MDAYEALITRVSPKELGEPAPDEATLGKIVAAALRAPDHGRLRPWRFISIRGEGRNRLGDLLAASLSRRDPNADAELERERQKPLRAPLVLVVAAHITQSPKIPPVEQLLWPAPRLRTSFWPAMPWATAPCGRPALRLTIPA